MSTAPNEWYVATVTSASGPSRVRTFSLRLTAALLGKVRARIWSGVALPSRTNHRMRSAITDVCPEPAPAMRNTGVSGCVMALACSGVGRNSDIGCRLPPRGLDRTEAMEVADPAVGVDRRVEVLVEDALGDGQDAPLRGRF